jgi:hypothetical protein
MNCFASLADVYRLSHDSSLAYRWNAGDVIQVDAQTSTLLRLCRTSRTLVDHSLTVARAVTASSRPNVDAVLEDLVVRGLLEPVGPSPVSARPSPDTLATLGIITADRPTAFGRCLETAVAEQQRYGRRLRVVVVDGSRSKDNRQANLAVVKRIRRETGFAVGYIGQEEAAAFRRAGGDEPWLSPGLTPGEIGANRNLLMLATAGERFVSIDDDVICTGWALPDARNGIEINAHDDGRRWKFFQSRPEAVVGSADSPVDVVAAHGGILGRSLADLCSSYPATINTLCSEVVEAVCRKRPVVVRLTFSGLAGDTAGYCPYFDTLFSSGRARQMLLDDSEQLAMALSSREVYRIADRTLVHHGVQCMAYCMGIANDVPLPPFMPLGRNSDGVFGFMTPIVEPDAHFADLPHAIIHDSHRPSAYESAAVPSASVTRLCDVVLQAAMSARASAISADRAARFAGLARVLSELGELDEAAFTDWFTRAVLAQWSRSLQQLESSEHHAQPHWRRAVERYRTTFRERVTQPGFFVPIEFRQHGDSGTGITRLQAWLKDYASLVRHWPALWETARHSGLGRMPFNSVE